jgi:hypothetical protein
VRSVRPTVPYPTLPGTGMMSLMTSAFSTRGAEVVKRQPAFGPRLAVAYREINESEFARPLRVRRLG